MYLFDKYTYQQIEMNFHRTLNLLMTEYMFEGHFNGNGCLFCEVDTDNKLRILFPKEYRRNYKIPYLDKIGVNYHISSEKMVSLNF